MLRITQVEPQKKNLHRFNIFLDGQFAFGVDEDLVVSQRLVIGKQIGAQDLEKLLFEAEAGKLMEKVYNLLSFRLRSEKEIRNWVRIKNQELRIKGKEQISDLVTESLINKLKEKGLINDLEFAKTWVESRSKKKGMKVIKQELFRKGIDREIVEEVIGSWFIVHSEEELAKSLLEKKIRVWKNLGKQEFKKKAFEFLMRKGFEYGLVKGVVEKSYQKG